MSGHFLLPPALLDLTLVRATARLQALSRPAIKSVPFETSKRCMHQATKFAEPPASTSYLPAVDPADRSLYARRKRRSNQDERKRTDRSATVPFMKKPLSELEARVRNLQSTVVEKGSVVEDMAYSEPELLSIYEDLLAIPSESTSRAQEDSVPRPSDAEIIQVATHRLLGPLEQDTSHHTLISRLGGIAADLDSMRQTFTPVIPGVRTNPPNVAPATVALVPTGILTEREWMSLVHVCLQDSDAKAVEEVLQLMKRLGHPPSDDLLNQVLTFYADSADMEAVERFLDTWIGSKPSEQQRDLHIKAALKANPPRALDSPALNLLHAYEARGLPAPQKSYTRTIVALLSCRTAVAEAHAWDLFSHMRYVAHPDPDAHMYALMISACSSSALSAQPERALDLFAEMTEDRRMPPTQATYCAVILACARSGERKFVHEAFRLAKQMLDAHRDARGRSEFQPNARVFAALLEGAKRVGDLAKTRWILAEMVQQSARAEQSDAADIFVNEPIMTHIFNAYAAYKPPFRRGAAPLVEKQKAAPVSTPQAEDISQPSGSSAPQQDDMQAQPPVEASHSSFSHLPPQTRAELLREVQTLFSRILEDVSAEDVVDQTSGPQGPFRRVNLTPRLLNAYLSVHYAHASFETWSNLYRTIFSEHGQPRTARTYVEALERCTISRKEERELVLPFAEEVWTEWQTVEDKWRANSADDVVRTINARLIERANTAMMRLLALTNHRTRALELVKSFAARYPPDSVKVVPPKPTVRSTRTVLVGVKPLVRLTSAVDVPDDSVPPLLSFAELEILHHRLIAAQDSAGIRYIKWLCKAYEGALRRRRASVVQARPSDGAPVPGPHTALHESGQDI
ncbi:hypothetical protein OBBRIDRAFT_825697 [Obba rivulosa]|uniref:Uncharacterized protein n=1 Tax=Obba rivulosa TaxID=1052685 RepID=A0A8E2AZ45_9APHY|nr:hypothetical protein OBBRIDRAFT_825697 [Obba rivulosa]